MPNYRRNLIPGGSYFFTVNLKNRNSDLLVTRIDLLRESVRQTRRLAPFWIDAWVVMPNHMHCVWTLPENDSDFPKRWHAIKSSFSKSLPLEGQPSSRPGDRGIWQRGYWEHTIRNEQDFKAHIDYTHFNPVKHGYVTHPADWPYSTYQVGRM